MRNERIEAEESPRAIRTFLREKVVIFFLFLSAAFSITYWAIAKYDVRTDSRACGDAERYIKMSQHTYEGVQQRYRNRVIMPFIVSLLNDNLHLENFLSRHYEDVDRKIIQLNFGIVNIFGIALTAYLLFFYCLYLGFSKLESLVAGFLFLTSFFVVNYFTVPMVDSLSALFLLGGFYAVLRGSLIGLFLSFSLGVFTKETTLIILVLILLEGGKSLWKKFLVCIPAVIAYVVFITHSGKTFSTTTDYYVFQDIMNILHGKFLRDITFNFYTVIENVQIYLFLWILFFYAFLKCRAPLFLRKASWLLLCPLIIPFLGAAVVGRVAFYFFPIVIPYSLLALRNIFGRTDDVPLTKNE